jgi:hypothetical protein
MPNGGVPMHMALYPKEGEGVVIYCRAGEVQLFTRAEWEKNKTNAAPLAVLTKDEGGALAWFLSHWLGEQYLKPGYCSKRSVRADFDF